MKHRFCVLLAILLSLCSVLIANGWIGQSLEIRSTDLFFKIRGEIPAPEEFVILSMDEQSYELLNLPMDKSWPRSIHAEALKKLKSLGAQKVVMDILFLNESDDPSSDRSLRDSISHIPTVLGADTGFQQGNLGVRYALEEILKPIPLFSSVAESIALVKMPEDNGIIRRFKKEETFLTKGLPILYEAAVSHIGKLPLPGDRDLIRFYGGAGSIKTYPYQILFDPSHPPLENLFKDKIIFIGLNLRTATGTAQKDTFRIPISNNLVFGVELQAQAAANVFEGRWIKRFSAIEEGLFVLLLSLVTFFLILDKKPQVSIIIYLFLFCIWGFAAYTSFLSGYYLPGFSLFAIVLPTIIFISTLIYYLMTYRSQVKIENAFKLYLPPEMAHQMRFRPNALELGGDTVWATALFSDIAGFSRISEKMDASDLASMLNDYFTQIVDVIFETKGTLVKFIGDAVFVIWGAPLKTSAHATNACHAAIKMQDVISKFNDIGKYPKLSTRIGIHTGSMLVGNLGSSKRFDYTAIGDSVNLASRLEGANKFFGTSILLSDNTANELIDSIPLVRIGKIKVAGKDNPTDVYAILSTLSHQAQKQWEDTLQTLYTGNLSGALNGFQEDIILNSSLSYASAFYQEKITGFITQSDTWNGVVELNEK